MYKTGKIFTGEAWISQEFNILTWHSWYLTFVPSLSEIGDLGIITPCLVLPGFLMDTLLSKIAR